jgi:peptidoglycan/LPS O-acetylase OafA/YrhL
MVQFPILLVFRRTCERMDLVGEGAIAQILAFTIAIALVIVAAAILSYLVERPARRRLRDQFGVLAPA